MPVDLSFDLPDTHAHVAAQLMGRSWKDCEVAEHAGYLLFPEKIHKRTKGGEFESVDVMLRVPRDSDRRKARRDARAWAAREQMDETADAQLYSNMEVMCTLTYVIRSTTAPFEPHEPDPEILEAAYDLTSLVQIWAKVDLLSDILDPAPEKISGNEMFAVIAAMASSRDIGPLVAFGSAAQASLIVTMAGQLMNFLGEKYSPELFEHSTQEH